MPSTFTPNMHLELPALGDQMNVWGTTLNQNFGQIDLQTGNINVTATTTQTNFNQADAEGDYVVSWDITGVTSLTAVITARGTAMAASWELRTARVALVGNPSSPCTVTLPLTQKWIHVANLTAQPVTFKLTTAPSGRTVTANPSRSIHIGLNSSVGVLNFNPNENVVAVKLNGGASGNPFNGQAWLDILANSVKLYVVGSDNVTHNFTLGSW